MDAKKEYISKLANHLVDNGKIMSGPEFADHLNRNGFQTSYGTDYEGKRGTYTLISATYKELTDLGRISDAENVAKAFVKEDGTPAYL